MRNGALRGSPARRIAWLGSGLAGLLATSLAAAASWPGGEAPLEPGAGGVVVVHLWATWCEPCTEELPRLAEFYRGPYRGLEERGLRLVTVSQDVRAIDLERYLAEHAPPFPVYLDSLGEVADRLALHGVPATVVLGTGGRVLARMLGPQDWASPLFHARLGAFLPDGGTP